MNKTKRCSKCKKILPIEAFAISKKGDGREYWCKECHRLYRLENLEKIKESNRKYYQENTERLKQYQKKYYQENKEMVAEKHRAYHEKNREKDNAWKRQWHKDNRPRLLEKKREYNTKNSGRRREYNETNRRRVWATRTLSMHRRKGLIVEISIDELHNLANKTNHCSICERELVWKAGHKKSIRASPTLDRIDNELLMRIGNVWIVCHRCNTIKGELTMKEYVEHCKMVVSKFAGLYDENELGLDPANEVKA
jgi:hypothetical protein